VIAPVQFSAVLRDRQQPNIVHGDRDLKPRTI